MSKTMALDAFLGHSTKGGGGGRNNYLKGWKKRTPPAVEVFLHRSALIHPLWQHSLPKKFAQKNPDGTETIRVFSGSFNCHESEAVLKKQYLLDRDTGERVIPPIVCPVCRMLEYFRGEYLEGNIGFADNLFKWVADDDRETKILSYGGMLNLYGKGDKLELEEKAAMTKAKVRVKDAWAENAFAKCNYVFSVVDVSDPGAGVQIAIETTSLGDHVKEAIANRMKSEGEDIGNPMSNPYAIRWEHHPSNPEFGKKYKAIPMPRIPLTPEIEKLITDEPPDLSKLLEPGPVKLLRIDLESAYIGKSPVNWDFIFGPAELLSKAASNRAEREEETEPKETAKPTPVRKAAPKVAEPVEEEVVEKPVEKVQAEAPATTGRRKKAEAPKPSVKMIPCEECGEPMEETALQCPACGCEYEAVEDETPAPPPPQQAKATKREVTF